MPLRNNIPRIHCLTKLYKPIRVDHVKRLIVINNKIQKKIVFFCLIMIRKL